MSYCENCLLEIIQTENFKEKLRYFYIWNILHLSSINTLGFGECIQYLHLLLGHWIKLIVCKLYANFPSTKQLGADTRAKIENSRNELIEINDAMRKLMHIFLGFFPFFPLTSSIQPLYFSVIWICSNIACPWLVFQLPDIDLRLQAQKKRKTIERKKHDTLPYN